MANPKKKQVCPIDAAGIKYIDYKDVAFLRQYLTKFNRIIPRYYTGVTLYNQKKLAVAIKRARYMALLPYVIDPRMTSSTTNSSATGDSTISSSSSQLDESAVEV